jgi:hypothetical protein
MNIKTNFEISSKGESCAFIPEYAIANLRHIPNSGMIDQAFTEDLMGVPFTATDTQLRDAVKDALERLQVKGVYDQIFTK